MRCHSTIIRVLAPLFNRTIGYIFSLPVGLSYFAGAWQEPALIKLAYAFEQAAQMRVPQHFLRQQI